MGIDVRVDVDALAGAEDTCLHRIHNYTYTKGKGVSLHMPIIIYYSVPILQSNYVQRSSLS